jgi:hypothetical protein
VARDGWYEYIQVELDRNLRQDRGQEPTAKAREEPDSYIRLELDRNLRLELYRNLHGLRWIGT